MTTLARTLKSRRDLARSRRAVLRAIESAPTPAAREDLIMAMQRSADARR